MRLRPLEPVAGRVAQHIAAISRRLKLDVLATRLPVRPATLIILGNGTPDDYVMALVAWACDGEKVAFITRPPEVGLTSAIKLLKSVYLPMSPGIRYIVLVIDRDKRGLSDITDEAERALRRYGFEISGRRELVGGWLKEFSCTWRPGAKVDILVLVSGLAKDERYSRDTVEVHLLEAAKDELGQDGLSGLLSRAADEEDEHGRADPKRAWGLLNREEQWRVFNLFRSRPELLESLFKQHKKALEMVP